MEHYLEHIPYFSGFVLLGAIVNLARKKVRKEKITTWRIIEEIFSTIWISLGVGVLLDEFTNLGALSIYVLASFSGFSNSFIIDKIGKGTLQAIADKIKATITGSSKTQSDE